MLWRRTVVWDYLGYAIGETASSIVESAIEQLDEEVEKRSELDEIGLKEHSDANVKKKLWQVVCEAVEFCNINSNKYS